MYNNLAIFIARKGGEKLTKEVEKLLKLEDYKMIKIEERSEKKEMKKIIYLESKNKRQKCPKCGEYTNSIHDKLRPIELKYLKIGEYNAKINIVKKRFICHKVYQQ